MHIKLTFPLRLSISADHDWDRIPEPMACNLALVPSPVTWYEAHMLAVRTPSHLDADACAAFRSAGFLSVPDFADPGDVARLRSLFVRLFASPVGFTAGDRGDLIGDRGRVGTIPQIVHLERYEPALLDSPVRQRGFAIARDLLGGDVLLDCETAILKVPGSPDSTPWHQDEAFWSAETTHDAISIWIPLQDVDADGGCMEFIAGSHRGEVRPHQAIRDVDDANGFELVDVDRRYRTICPLPAGAATVHHSRVAHSSGPNCTAIERYAYVMVFVGPRRPPSVKREFTWQGGRARDKRRVASRVGLDGLLNRVLRRAAIVVAKLNAWNDRRRYSG